VGKGKFQPANPIGWLELCGMGLGKGKFQPANWIGRLELCGMGQGRGKFQPANPIGWLELRRSGAGERKVPTSQLDWLVGTLLIMGWGTESSNQPIRLAGWNFAEKGWGKETSSQPRPDVGLEVSSIKLGKGKFQPAHSIGWLELSGMRLGNGAGERKIPTSQSDWLVGTLLFRDWGKESLGKGNFQPANWIGWLEFCGSGVREQKVPTSQSDWLVGTLRTNGGERNVGWSEVSGVYGSGEESGKTRQQLGEKEASP